MRDLDACTRGSVHHAVVVLRDEDKMGARAHFRTPLVFSVHEAKGLEYPHVILYALVSNQRAAYAEVCSGVTPADLTVDELHYSRAKDKGDKSLELYKFYVNALYVAMTRAVDSLTLVESDTAHPLLGLLGLKEATAENAQASAPVQTSTREEWAQEARKLELQGKEEQARAIRDAFLQVKATPWAPWSDVQMQELLPRALDPKQPSGKPRQTLMDYALWHGQQVWVEQLALKARFQPALNLAPGGEFGQVRIDDMMGDFVRQEQLAWRAVAALRHRHLQPYAAHNFKDLLRQCDTYGVDHRTPTGATTLMLAARAGNLPLVDALLLRGADPLLEDEFGHTPWLAVLGRALEDIEFASRSIAPMFERIAPATLDVQTDGRLVRLERHQGEFWLLSMMLAGIKTLRTRCAARPLPAYKYQQGFFAEHIWRTLECLPEHLWKTQRRKRSYINAVLARAEAQSLYQPARRLWLRTATGHYLPNPLMQLRTHTPEGPGWRPVYEVLNLPWVDAAWAQPEKRWYPSMATLLEAASRRLPSA